MKRLLAGLLTVAVTFVAGPSIVEATWTSAAVGHARARARVMPAGNTPTVVNGSGAGVVVTWTASADMPAGSGYVVRSYDAGGGVERAITAACSGILLTTTCTEAGAPTGSWRYTITPALGAWRGTQSAPSAPVVVDATAPTVTITHPLAGGTYSPTSWNDACSSSICGTAADAHTGVASVQVSVRREATGLYWNGTSFASATEILTLASGTTTWSLPFAGAGFPLGGAYTARAVATDGRGNTGSAAATFSIDATPPQATLVTLTNSIGGTAGVVNAGDVMEMTFSEALDPSSICPGGWTATAHPVLTDVTISMGKLLGNDQWTFASTSCTTLNIGTVTTSSSYVALLGSLTSSGSTLSWDPVTNRLRVQLGTISGVGLDLVPDGPHAVSYTPAPQLRDRVGNQILPNAVTNTNQRF